MNRNNIIWGSVLFLFLGFSACVKTEEDTRPNPFANQKPDEKPADSLDPTTIQGLHKYIFFPKCGSQGACHDGTFEPDFRTVTSTYSHLVYYPVTKNDSKGSFVHRVVPGDTKKSWLVERLVTDDKDLGRMPLYAPPLNQTELSRVKKWIEDGARDMEGNPAVEPNNPPNVLYRLAYDLRGNRLDTILYGSSRLIMKLPPNTEVILAILVEDDKTPVKDLHPNYFKFSFQRFDFGNAQTKNAFMMMGTWVVQFNTNEFPLNRQIFYRYYTNDGTQPQNVEHPNNQSDRNVTDIFSFYVVD